VTANDMMIRVMHIGWLKMMVKLRFETPNDCCENCKKILWG